MDSFLTAEERRMTSEEAKKVIMLTEMIDKYLKAADKKAEIASKYGQCESVLFINEQDYIVNKTIASKVSDFLKSKGYSIEINEENYIIMLHYFW